MTIEWNKIVTNAVSALMISVFLGATTIVWKGATSVDDKVQPNVSRRLSSQAQVQL